MYKQLKFLIMITILSFALTSNLVFAKVNKDAVNKINSNPTSLQNDDFAPKHAKDLQNRLGLTNEQTNQVVNILSEYRDDVLNKNPNDASMNKSPDPHQQTANDRIAALLDENQKAAFAQMQKEWWANVNQEIGRTNRKVKQ